MKLVFASTLLFLFASAECQGSVFDSPELSKQQKREGDVVLASLKERRLSLKAGIFKVKGIRRRNDMETPFEIYCVFDRSMARFRFERVEGELGGKFLKTPDRIVQMANRGGVISIDSAEEKPLRHIQPFDVRLVGLLSTRELEMSLVEFGSKGFFDDIFSLMFGAEKLVAIQSEHDGGSRELTLSGDKKERYVRKIHFDVKTESLAIDYRVESVNSDPNPNPFYTVKTNWIRNNGVFVPKKLVNAQYSRSGNAQVEMEFEWSKVNTKIADKLFTLEGLDLSPNRLIVDRRNGQNVILGRTGADGRSYRRKSGTLP